MYHIAHHPIFSHPLPEGHRFPMQKYEWIPEQLLLEGVAEAKNFFTPNTLDISLVKLAHQNDYVNAVIAGSLAPMTIRKIGFPMSTQLIERELRIAKGTIDGALSALKKGVAFNTAGGTHHAGSNWGEGFCIFNDQAIAAKYLISTQKVHKIAIIDLDVHQGNGTAEIFRNDASVYTFSIHGAKNFPFKKEVSDWDIALDDGIKDAAYLLILKEALEKIIDEQKPEFIFYQAGVDVLASDKLGKFSLSIQGCKQRDEMVFKTCEKHRIPVQVSMGGGYTPDIKTIVQAHVNTYKAAKDILGY